MVLTASNAIVNYAYERIHGATIGNTDTDRGLFGINQRISSLNWSNSMKDLANLGTPEIQQFAFGADRGSCTVDYHLSNPFPFSSILGELSLPPSGSGNPDQRWTSIPGDGAIKPLTMNLQFAYQGEGGSTSGIMADVRRQALGAVATTMSISTSIDNMIDVSHAFTWGREGGIRPEVPNNFSSNERPSNRTFANLGASTLADKYNAGFPPYTFANASIFIADGTVTGAGVPAVGSRDAVLQVQSFDINFDTGAEQLYQIGSPSSVDAYRKLLRITGRINLAVQDPEMFERVVRRPTPGMEPGMIIRFSNNETQERTIQMTLRRVAFSEHSTGFEPGEPVYEDLSFQAGSITVDATNGYDDDDLPTNAN